MIFGRRLVATIARSRVPALRCHGFRSLSTSAISSEGAAAYSSRKLYDTHIPITTTQRTLLTIGSAFAAFANPKRGDMVATLGETTGKRALEKMREQMLESESGRKILRERPIVHTSTIDFDNLRATCAPGTFGHEYVSWLDQQGVTPDTRDPVHFIDDEELAYVMQRYRQAHDFVHTLTGLGVTVEEELALKWFEWVQTGLPMNMLSSLVGPFIVPWEARRRLFNVYVPWALQCGSDSVPLMTVYFEKHFHTPIENLRKDLGITPPPSFNTTLS